MSDEETSIFDIDGSEPFTDPSKEWKNEWKGMPEFVQNKQEPYAKVIFRFENEEDLQEFASMINQKLTSKTKSSWHPFKPHRKEGGREVYVDRDEVSNLHNL